MRTLNFKRVMDKKAKKYMLDGDYLTVLGNPETHGAWLVYGREKNGKTWFSVKLAEYLSQYATTLYVSAEEGLGDNFKGTCMRANIALNNNRLQFTERVKLSELSFKLKKQRSASIIVIDNMTVYREEFKNKGLMDLLNEHPKKLFIFLAHEQNGNPHTAAAVLCKMLAKIIIRVEGLACHVSGRCPGGTLIIDEEKALIYHGTQIFQK